MDQARRGERAAALARREMAMRNRAQLAIHDGKQGIERVPLRVSQFFEEI